PRIEEVRRREVDRDVEVEPEPVPLAALARSLFEDEAVEVDDDPAPFGGFDECTGVEHAVTRMAPANERLHAADDVRAEVRLRLVEDPELVVRERVSQLRRPQEV